MNFTKPVQCELSLRFTPYAMAKIIYMRDVGDTEIGGYGITATEDPLLVTDFQLVKQECTSTTVELDEKDSGDFLDRMMDIGVAPWQCQNIWIHTHPGNCPNPSHVDEDNFRKNFSHCHWSVFYILAREGAHWCRIQYNVGPGGSIEEIPIVVDYSQEFLGSDFEAWEKEYKEKVVELCFSGFNKYDTKLPNYHEDIWDDDYHDSLEHEICIFRGHVCCWHDGLQEYIFYDPEKDKIIDSDNELFVPSGKPDIELIKTMKRYFKEHLDESHVK